MGSNHSHSRNCDCCAEEQVLVRKWDGALLKNDVVVSVRIQRSTAEALQQVASTLDYRTLSQFLRRVIEDSISRAPRLAGIADSQIQNQNASERDMDPLDELAERLSRSSEKM